MEVHHLLVGEPVRRKPGEARRREKHSETGQGEPHQHPGAPGREHDGRQGDFHEVQHAEGVVGAAAQGQEHREEPEVRRHHARNGVLGTVDRSEEARGALGPLGKQEVAQKLKANDELQREKREPQAEPRLHTEHQRELAEGRPPPQPEQPAEVECARFERTVHGGKAPRGPERRLSHVTHFPF